ncbi:hypothetical protein K435DRAFT_862594 [Dendrothele bispora CBS 962.96]|uniref:G domain-containing protein n=1 Tax=Dendrothele bispora (strain CBS 962.96) TaxID=1314807 RepID=A0A4S8LTG9_DENBC|nr:hypothetical protein K435DRAFT_862594 [Dendrothele bispora CBS 962.96]
MSTGFQQSDIVILVTGLVGAGKSTFINTYLEELGKPECMKVGDPGSLKTCTTQIKYEIVNPSSRHNNRLVIVDTPGFNDENKSDLDVLQEIASWVQRSFPRGACRGGIIYLHDVSNDRHRSMDKISIAVLKKSFVNTEGVYRRIVLINTKWSKVESQQRANRKTKLDSHWKQLTNRVSKHYDSDDIASGAKGIVEDFWKTLESGGALEFENELKFILNYQEKRRTFNIWSWARGLLGKLLGST